MSRLIFIVILSVFPISAALASESAYPLDHMTPNLADKASLQRGMQTYMNYCFGCHSLKYQRFKRTAEDLEIPESLMLEHLVFDPDVRIGALMENALSSNQAKNWFGAAPPDLTLVNNLKGGPDWVYTYLRTFYEDDSRPFGVNNLVFESVAMPHVLAGLQGVQRKVCKDIPRIAPNGGQMMDPLTNQYITENKCDKDLIERGFSPLEVVPGSGELSAEQYQQLVYDLTNFLYYTAEPIRMDRQRIGGYVLLFLAFFYIFTWLLGREYAKEYKREYQ
jgi:ubiquinol-cytochrome c reductase cytochrome b subunit